MRRNRPTNKKPPLTETATSIGGIPIGCVGTSGIYSGYTMVGGDDFNTPLDIISARNPFGRYLSTKGYSAGARSGASLLGLSYDCDPFFSGSQDVNKGVPVGTNTLRQGLSSMTLQARAASAVESATIGNRPIATSMMGSASYVQITPPFIVESLVSTTPASQNPQGWHSDFWIFSPHPIQVSGTPATPGVDFNFEGDHGQFYASSNLYGSTTGLTAYSGVNIGNTYGTPHVYSFLIDGTNATQYIDGVSKKNSVEDATSTNRPFVIWYTSHTFNGGYQNDPNVNVAAWVASGTNAYSGAALIVGWYRIWLPNAQAGNVLVPSQRLPNLQVDYNTSVTYTFPSATALWGAGITDFVQTMKIEDFEPGSASEIAGTYDVHGDVPDGLTYNSGTRVLTGVTSDKKPGRLITTAAAYLPGGGMSYVARGFYDVGPHVTAIDFVLVNSTAVSIDLYQVCDCGNLSFGKIITCTNLPSGLSFDPITYLITGTPTVNATTSITIGVTNSVGQTTSKSVNLIVQSAADSIALDGTPITSITGNATISTSLTRDLLILINYSSTACPYVTDTAGLTWVKAGTGFSSSTVTITMDVWYARVNGTVTNNVITPALSGGGRIVVFAAHGLNTINPLDTNVSVPAVNSDTTATSLSSTISTDSAANLIVAAVRGAATLGVVTEPSGFTQLVATGANEDASYQINSSALSGVTETYSWTGTTTQSAMIIAAFQGQV